MQVGDLVKFDYVNDLTSHINNKLAIYLGERSLYKESGGIVNNFEVHIIGARWPSLCDASMKCWLKVVGQ